MTTTAHEDQFTVGTQTIEPTHKSYDTASILPRNVADLELALKRQTERAEKAEAELAKFMQQNPVFWYAIDEVTLDYMVEREPDAGMTWIPLYASPVPVPHKGATHCDDCGLTWLDDGLNPLWCPYCKDSAPAPAVPSVVFMAHNKTSSILFAARKDADQYAASFGPAAGVSVTECAVIGSQSAEGRSSQSQNEVQNDNSKNQVIAR